MGLLLSHICTNPNCNSLPLKERPESILCYFDAHEYHPGIIIPVSENTITMLEVEVITTMDDQRVRIDGSLNLDIITISTLASLGMNVTLQRNEVELSKICILGNLEKSIYPLFYYEWKPHFTFIDKPGTTGTYRYRILVSTHEPSFNVTGNIVWNRQLKAMLYPPNSNE